MLKNFQKNKCIFIFGFLLSGVIFGRIIQFSSEYFYIPFSDLVTNSINILLAFLVTYILSEKINRNTKIIDLQLEGTSNFDSKIEEIHGLYLTFSVEQGSTITKAFTQASIALELLSNFDLSGIQIQNYDELKQDFNKYWGSILDTISIDTFTSFSPDQQDSIEEAYRSLNSSIYNFKVSLFK